MTTSIKSHRKAKGITQVKLAEITSMDQASISRIENDKQGVSVSQLQRIANALQVELSELVENDAHA